MTKLPDQRLRLILVLSSLAFAVVVTRAVYIQVVQASSLAAKARGQQNATIIVPTSRGRILDSSGQPLAQDVAAKDLMVHPAEVQDPVQTANFIAQMIGFKPKHKKALLREVNLLVPRLTVKGVVEARVIPQLDVITAARIMAAKPPGLFLDDSVRRDYPTKRQAAQLLGYTDFANSGADGAGLEQRYNSVLTGRSGERLEVRGPGGVPLDTITLRRPQAGHDIQLTINRAIQAKVQSVIDGTVQQFHAHSATAIVLDPKTGEILAMVSSPGYDNNAVHDLPARSFHDATQNMAVEYSYEPGSTFKVVTMAAALTNHIVQPGTVFHDLPYQIQVGDKTVHDDVPRGPIKSITVRKILQESSNVGTVTIARMVGKTLLSTWIDRFGFGRTTGVDLPGEAPGILLPPDKWYDSSIGNIPIGQGIAVTPMQMAAMYSAIANGGVLVQPHVVKRIEGEPKPDFSSRRILDAGIDHQLVNMLKGVVDTATGTGVRARIPGYTVAGKTGTAQKALAHGLGYSTRNYVASFVGFLPADDPQVEVLVVVDSPRGNIFGGYVAAPAFKDIATSLTQLLAIPPDRRISP
jgi:cell division protein FtsI (penicillin-binding protein 3)/stage V sporulation protein D (sporulation-specific penicillin-binding protein)